MNWVKQQINVSGILTPEVDGKRKLFDVTTKTYYPLESDKAIASEEQITVGRFSFYKKSFDLARESLIHSLKQNPEWLVVDEVGKLELYEQKGLEPALTKLIEDYKNKKATGKLVLIIRDTLLNECIAHFGLQDATIVNKEFFFTPPQNDLYGLIVCGGESKRMGADKSLINYHGNAQRYYLYEILQSVCEKVFISCNQFQSANMEAGYEIIVDDPQYQNIGPMAALLSAYEKYPDKSLVVIGCDYPFIGKQEIQTLINARDQNYLAVCYQNQQSVVEPLLALYENKIGQLLKNNFSQHKHSLRYFLEEVNAKRVIAKDASVLKSVDTKEELEAALKKH